MSLEERLRREIRRMIAESYSPSWAEERVFDELHRMSGPRGLPVTHETGAENIESIKADGAVEGSYGIFFSVGHLKKPEFITGPGYMIHGYLPRHMLNSNTTHPDMIYTPGNVDEDDMLTGEEEDSFEVMWNQTRGQLYGALLSTNLDEWPEKYWERIVPNGL